MLLRNFLFHRVSNEKDSMWPPMTPLLFTKVISYLTKNYTVISLEEFLRDKALAGTRRKFATISFDDGYKDNIEFAVPILQKFKCAASFYVVTDCIDKNLPTWTYIVDHALQNTRKPNLEFAYSFVPENLRSVNLAADPGKSRQIKPWMKTLSNNDRVRITTDLISQCNDVQLPSGKMMNWKDIREMNAGGFIIGSHSHTHPMLASLQDSKEIKEELVTSADRIKQELGFMPLTISYPIGSYDDRVVSMSSEAGYEYGLAVDQQFFRYPSNNMKIPRVELYQEGWNKMKLHLSGNYWNRLKRLIR